MVGEWLSCTSLSIRFIPEAGTPLHVQVSTDTLSIHILGVEGPAQTHYTYLFRTPPSWMGDKSHKIYTVLLQAALSLQTPAAHCQDHLGPCL